MKTDEKEVPLPPQISLCLTPPGQGQANSHDLSNGAGSLNVNLQKRRRMKPAIRKRLITRVCLFILLPIALAVSILLTLTYKNAYEVYVGGKLIHCVRYDKDVGEETIRKSFIELLTENNGAEARLIDSLSLSRVRANNNIISQDELLALMLTQASYEIRVAGFIKDGEPIAILKTSDEASSLANNIINKYVDDNASLISYIFLDNVQVEDIFAQKQDIMTMGEALDALMVKQKSRVSYTVCTDDTLTGVAAKFSVSLAELMSLNPGVSSKIPLREGQTLAIEPMLPIFPIQTVSTVTETVTLPMPVTKQVNPRAATTRVVQEGKEGEQIVTRRITKLNDIIISDEIINTITTFEAVARIEESAD
ncbi:MAG: LysM peptidoglycan-binding domain-containing protein [Clostridiales bacterium]|nr:LysM peptidoglycan-binding domain-containing protein [Clostridiales bacterium]